MASLPAMLIDENKALKARIAELEDDVKRLQKERDYSVRWANTSVDSVKEHMWKLEDALQNLLGFSGSPQSMEFEMAKDEARAALLKASGEPQ